MLAVIVAVALVLLMAALLAVPRLLRNRPSPAQRLRRRGVDDGSGDTPS